VIIAENFADFNSTSLLPRLNFEILNLSDEMKALCTNNIRQTIYVINIYELLLLMFQCFRYEMMLGIYRIRHYMWNKWRKNNIETN